MARAVVPRGQVPIPPEICEFLKNLYAVKGGMTGFAKRSGIKSDTLRLAIKRGTTTEGTLRRLTSAVSKAGALVPVKNERRDVPQTNGRTNAESAVQVEQLPPAVLRQIERVSSALLDGMQLMQLTVLKALQEELGGNLPPLPPRLTRTR